MKINEKLDRTGVILTQKDRDQILEMVADGVLELIPDEKTGQVILKKLAETEEDILRINKELDEKGMENKEKGLFIPNRILRDPRLKELDWYVYAMILKHTDKDLHVVTKLIKREFGYAKGNIHKSIQRLATFKRITINDEHNEKTD